MTFWSMDPGHQTGPQGAFPQTHWSVVVAAGGSTTLGSEAALAELCRTYWYPLYAFARRRGHGVAEAQDLTQGFFAHLIGVRLVARADEEKGRFRSFLLGAFKRFIGSEEARARAQKRGGDCVFLSLDRADGEVRFGLEQSDHCSPERVFDRNWAMTVLERALARLEAEFVSAGRAPLFHGLALYLQGDVAEPGYAEVAGRLGTTEGSVRVTVLRMRRRYRELLRLVVMETLEDPRDGEDELRHLRAALRD